MAETIGQQLKYARMAQRLSIEDAVEATRIRPNYIEALEADNFDAFPSPAQGRGFLHNYAEFLGLRVEDILARQRETSAPTSNPTPVPTKEPAPAAPEPLPAPAAPEPAPTPKEPEPFSWTTPLHALPSSEITRPPESLVSTPSEPAPSLDLPLWENIPAFDPAAVTTKPARRAPRPKEGKPIVKKPAKKETKRAAVKPAVKETKIAPVKVIAAKTGKEKKPAPAKAGGVKPAAEGSKPVEKKKAAAKPAMKKNAKPAAKQAVKPVVKKTKPSAAPVKKKAKSTRTKEKAASDLFIEYETPPPPTPAFEPLPEITYIPAQEPLPEPELLPENEAEPESETAPEPEIPAAKALASSEEIFASIGEELRERRELLGMTLDEIERHTHVRKHYLESIESGKFGKLPSSVQARGMINNYARFLDMDAEALLLRFADGLQTQHQERYPTGEGMPEKPARRGKVPNAIRRYLSVDMFIGGGLVILLILFAIWGTNKIISMRSTPTVQATSPSISDILLTSPTAGAALPTDTPLEIPTALPTAAGQTEAAAVLPTGAGGAVHIILIASERAYVVVTVDGVVKFNGRVVPGTAYPFDAKEQIEVLTGNGAAIKINYNGTDLGTMGTFGQVVDLIYTVSAVITPTATSTPTATASPKPSATPIPSATPKPSVTPRVTSTSTP